MLQHYRAEQRKISGYRGLIWLTIWIFPIASAILIAISGFALKTLSADLQQASGLMTMRWDEQTLTAWTIPSSGLGQLFIIGFMAVVFGGEYQWGTWKNLTLRARRSRLILAKYIVVVRYMVLAMVLTSIVVGVGSGLILWFVGGTYEPPISGPVVTHFIGSYIISAVLAMVRTTISACVVAIAAMLSQNVVGSMLAGSAISIAEGLSYFLFAIVGNWFNSPTIPQLIKLLPGYNITNLSSWLINNAPTALPTLTIGKQIVMMTPNDLPTSALVTLLWISGLIALSVWIFRRQDITT